MSGCGRFGKGGGNDCWLVSGVSVDRCMCGSVRCFGAVDRYVG